MASSTGDAKYLCPECGMPAGGVLHPTTDPHVLTLTINAHECNPRLLEMFNPDSQHCRPFQR